MSDPVEVKGGPTVLNKLFVPYWCYSIVILALLTLGGSFEGLGQSGLRQKTFEGEKDTLELDSLSLAPGSVEVLSGGKKVSVSRYEVDPVDAELIWKGAPPEEPIVVKYRVIRLDLTKRYEHKSRDLIQPKEDGDFEPYVYRASRSREDDLFGFGGLNKSGNISRGLSFGNNQDLSVNSNLSLELSGPLNDEVSVLASVTDDNIPIQPEGNTQQLQDFDKVFIKFFNDRSELIAGDYQLKSPDSRFLQYFKRAKGATFSSTFPLKEGNKDKGKMSVQASGAISKGKFARNVIQGVEGNQGPYRLRGNNNEPFIVVLAGTEKVYVDGKLMERGQENDYVVDYNAAEITFTPNVLINTNTRIKVEFQYSEKSYARSLFQFSNTYEREDLEMTLNVYSEQDAKNQPLQQELSDDQKQALSIAGDDPTNAVVPSIERDSSISNNAVSYKMVDSLGYDSVFVYSTNREIAVYKLNFSEVGFGNGNYVKDEFTPNGRVYRWVPPDTMGNEIVPQGNYAPVILLTAPQQKQMVTYGGEYSLDGGTTINWEGALSNHDRNTFSDLDEGDDVGGALRLGIEQDIRLQEKEDSAWKMTSKVQLEHIQRHFEPIERYRAVEFDRDWNIRDQELDGPQQIGSAGMDFNKKGLGNVGYRYRTFRTGHRFLSGTKYNGGKHVFDTDLSHRGFRADIEASMLNTEGAVNSKFIRHIGNVEKSFGFLTLGYEDEHERNERYTDVPDSLSANSYQFYEWKGYVTNSDTATNRYRLYYGQRFDKAPKKKEGFNRTTFAREYGLDLTIDEGRNSRLKGKVAYRQLEIIDDPAVSQKPENTLVNRVEYDIRAWDNVLSSSTFYQVGSGLERKKEFVYLQVPAGQGSYTWNDYNDNNVKELNEFEVAKYSDQAKYIRSFIRTNEYAKTFSNQFQQTLRFRPSAKWGGEKGFKGFLARLSDQVAYKVDRKTNDNTSTRVAYDPSKQDVSDSTLLSLNSSFRNTIFFDRSDPVFGMDYTYRDARNKSLLSSGFNSRLTQTHEIHIRWNLTRSWTLESTGGLGRRVNSSDFLNGRNYAIESRSMDPRLDYQPNTKFRIGAVASYEEKFNKEKFGGESAIIREGGFDLKFNSRGKGTVRMEVRFVKINYTGEEGNSTAFQMLESLNKGKNITWNLTIQRSLSDNLQLDLNYNGRTSEDHRTIHNGGVQVRAYF